MRRLKYILVATDLSSPAHQAADRAARLARSSGAQLRIVHVVSAGVAAQLQQLIGLGSALEAKLFEATRQELQTLADELAAQRDVKVDAALVQVSVADEVTRKADAMQAGLARRRTPTPCARGTHRPRAGRLDALPAARRCIARDRRAWAGARLRSDRRRQTRPEHGREPASAV